jgi:hypothetical protein
VPITQRGHNLITKVSELINQITGNWDEQMVVDIFCAEDAQTILSIPLRDDMEDFPAWAPDTKGQFSVRSAYKVLARRDLPSTDGATVSGTAQSTNDRLENAMGPVMCAKDKTIFVEVSSQ